ncbi:protein translocase subunit SecF [Cellulomonas aerilata]|uniref:Protein-export membrane protein SecF n=1 Tax=Cellulomonas aerilata TaxID=515326 RepID=A0A512DAG0_9CELL|nr:protein translocase subunit SecF [Cellulomonas aerilata]GEO33367.1 protein-export membrane protein SecF [Cellulomonas aerilata]
MAASGFAQWGNDLYTGRRSYDIVGLRRRWYAIALALVLASAALLLTKGLNPGIEFRGGSQFTVSGARTVEQQPAIDAVAEVSPTEEARVSTVGDDAIRVQTAALSAEEVTEVRGALASAYGVSEDEVTSSFIGPSWGKDVSSKAITGLIAFLALVTVVMTLYFRAWRMAVAALLALAHDLVITVGIYALVGWEVTPATVIGFLTILGYSIYDTVVVFDKVRENTQGVLEQSRSTYGEQANLAVNQTLVRSINTSVVAVLPVAAILFVGAFLLGAGTLRDIALALFVGMIVGTFSSVFLATPLEVTLRGREARIAGHTARVLEARGVKAPAADGEPAAVGTGTGPTHGATRLEPGHHLGAAAQPRRRRTGRR